jgi:hypothetical protein
VHLQYGGRWKSFNIIYEFGIKSITRHWSTITHHIVNAEPLAAILNSHFTKWHFTKKIPEQQFGFYRVVIEAVDSFGNKRVEETADSFMLY